MFESFDWGAPPGPVLAAALDGRGWAQAGDQDLVGALVATEQVSAWVAGVQAEVLAELARRRPPDPHDRSVAARGDGLDAPVVPCADEAGGAAVGESVRGPIRYSVFTADEVAAAVGWSWNVASTRLRVAVDLATRLPRVGDALHAGQVDWPRARAISEATRGLGAEAAWRVADQGLQLARTQTVGRVREKVTAAALAADPALASRRHARARTDRGMVHHGVADGMAMFGAVMPAADAALAAGAVDALARSGLAPGDPRTLEQARVDAFTDTLITGCPRPATPASAPPPASTPAPPASTPAPPASTPAPPASTPAPAAAPTTGGGRGRGCQCAGEDQRRDDPGGAPGGQGQTGAGQEPAGGSRGRVSAVVNITVPLTTLLRHAAATTDWTTRPDEDGGSPATGRAGTDHGSGTVEESFAWWWPLLGVDLGRLPGQVGRAGPVAAEQVVTAALQALAGGAPARWIVTGPSGTAWAATTPTHRRPKWLDHAIRTLDRTCRAPGCRRPAEACDIDHVIPYPRGATTATNLTALCRHHHRMKTHAGWSCRLLPDRRVEWVSPTGLTYTTHPGRWLPPLEPPNWLDFPDLPDEPSGAEAAEPPDRAPEVGNGSPAGTATADSGAPADQQEPPWLEACGPDTHPFLGVPTSLGVTDPDRWTDPDEWTDDPHGTTDELHGTHDLHSADERADFQGHHPDEWLPPPPWTPADPNAEDPLDQDPTDWRLYTTIFQ